jgi:ribosome-binding protein aMBF1 (putative translation factor)
VICNEREYRITRSELRKFEEAAAEYTPSSGLDPRMKEVMTDALNSMAETLRSEMQRYEDLRDGQVNHRKIEGIKDIPAALIEARIAAGLTQKNLAERLDLKPQQIQRWESNGYSSTSLARLWEVAHALEITLSGKAEFASLAEQLPKQAA